MNISESKTLAALSIPEGRSLPQAGLLIALMFVTAAISLFRPTQFDVAWNGYRLQISETIGEEISEPPMPGQANWQNLNIEEIGSVNETAWIRMEVNLPSGSGPIPPYALFLAGPFSAEAFWDGTALGSKGVVGSTPDKERPGPIDAVFYIPELLSRPGKHELLLHVSSQHVGYQAQALFHNLFVGSHQHDPRRQLRFYALPLILSGCLVLFMLHFSRVFISSGSRSALILSLVCLLLLLQMGLEISRSLVAYSYDWHVYRSLGIWLCAFGCGLSLALLAHHRQGLESKAALWAIVLIALVASYLVRGFDNKAAAALLVFSLFPIGLGIRSWFSTKPDLLLFSGAILGLAWMACAAISVASLLDSAVYFTAVTYLGMAWFWTSRGRESFESPPDPAKRPAHFLVRHAGRTERINGDSVKLVSAAGNFTELICRDGRTVLHHLRIGQIMENPPAGFFRVHRSYAVNLDSVRSLKIREGSRYSLELDDGHEVPVSRYQVAELRQLLADS